MTHEDVREALRVLVKAAVVAMESGGRAGDPERLLVAWQVASFRAAEILAVAAGLPLTEVRSIQGATLTSICAAAGKIILEEGEPSDIAEFDATVSRLRESILKRL